MGISLADAAADYGAEVDLILGPVSIAPANKSVNVISVTTAESMASETISRFRLCDIAILTAAVADFTPLDVKTEKIKKKGNEALGKTKKKNQFLAGFALETTDEISNAKEKLLRKNLDIIVLNSLRDSGAGFGHETNKITIIDRNNNIDKFELKSKEEAAKDILDKIVSLIS
jgi:phosphopantothenoylcysteine decarboxylase/phosphopantothenate--cysteine ligase